MGDVMATFRLAPGDRIIDPMIALAGCAMQHRILVAGSKSVEMMIELHRRGYFGAASTGNCGRRKMEMPRAAWSPQMTSPTLNPPVNTTSR